MGCAPIPCGNDCIAVGTYNICIDGFDLGSTTGGLTLSREAEYVDVRNDQSCTRQARYLKQQDWMFKTTLQCVTLDKMKLVYGLPNSYIDANGESQPTLDGTTLTFAEDQSGCVFSREFPVQICGPGPGCGCRVMTYPNVQATPEQLDYNITKDNPVQLEVEFTILADCETGIIGTWSDDCDIIVECSSDPIACPPEANPMNVGIVPSGGSFFGQIDVSVVPGSSNNLTYELTDPTDPKAANVEILPNGSFVISN